MAEDTEWHTLTDDERKAIAALERVAKRWPQTLMLASMAGTLIVVPTADHEVDGVNAPGLDYDKVLATVYGIPNTGGDW